MIYNQLLQLRILQTITTVVIFGHGKFKIGIGFRMTAQKHENIIYEGKDLSMFSFPYFPEKHPRIFELPDEEITRVSSACLRGYIGSWEIKNGQLFLIKLEGGLRLEGQDPLFAGWFSGELKIIIAPVFDGLRSGLLGFEKIKEVQVKNGLVVEA